MTNEESKKLADSVDWSVYDWPVSTTCICVCGFAYRSHAKMLKTPEGWRAVTKEACPGCGTHAGGTRLTGDPETMTVKG